MPQLNPNPWFLTFLFSWGTLILLMTPKLLNTQPQKEMNFPYTHLPKPWTWPWS
nr:ATPase subunit 8 [Nephrurus amyae]